MADNATAEIASPPTVPAAAPAAAAPWYQGKAEAEIVGHWQNRGIDLADPVNVAIEMTKAHREAERHIGVPADQLLRMPKATAQPAEIKAFWERLGVPKEAKDYDLSAIRFDGNELEQGFADTMRQTLLANFVPKERAAPIVDAVVKWLEGQQTADTAAADAKRAEQMAALDRNWGPNKAANMLAADQGASRLGVTADEVKAIGEVIGLDRAAELFRKIGAGTSEDSFHEAGRSGAAPATAEAASARLAELQRDAAWTKRLLAGDVQARIEFDNLTRQSISWVPDAA